MNSLPNQPRDPSPASDAILDQIRRLHWCGIYTRQSREPKDDFSSCQAQFETCLAYVTSRFDDGWVFNGRRYDDEAESSETLDRPGFQRLLQHIREGKVQRVVIHRLDRLSRRLADCAQILHELHDLRVPLSIVKQSELSGSAADTMLLNLMASFAEFEQQMTRERMAESRTYLKRQGRRIAGVVPYGYQADPISKQLILIKTEANHVRKMFELAADGKKPTEISAMANKRGWRTKQRTSKSGHVSGGGRWTARQVVAVLSNPVYAGLIRDGEQLRPGAHASIVNQKLFEAVRETIASRCTSSRDRTASLIAWPRRGLLRCGQCGRLLNPSISGYKNFRYRYYRCRSDAGGAPKCQGVSLPAHEIETFVMRAVGDAEFHPPPTGTDDSDESVRQCFLRLWQKLSSQDQSKAMPRLIREVVYDPKRSRITMKLNPDTVELMVQAATSPSSY